MRMSPRIMYCTALVAGALTIRRCAGKFVSGRRCLGFSIPKAPSSRGFPLCTIKSSRFKHPQMPRSRHPRTILCHSWSDLTRTFGEGNVSGHSLRGLMICVGSSSTSASQPSQISLALRTAAWPLGGRAACTCAQVSGTAVLMSSPV